MPANILVVEDEPAIQSLIAANLTRAGHIVQLAGDAESTLRQIQQVLPDLILLDWMLPGMSGIDLAHRIRTNERMQTVPIIMLTARGNKHDKILGLESGVDDYITKPFSSREMLLRVKAILHLRTPQTTEDVVEIIAPCGVLRLESATHRVTAGSQAIDLGPTEFRLLHFLMTHTERVYSRTQLLDQVWGDHIFVEEKTINVYIRRLRAVLEASGYDVLIQTVRFSGYRFSTVVVAH